MRWFRKRQRGSERPSGWFSTSFDVPPGFPDAMVWMHTRCRCGWETGMYVDVDLPVPVQQMEDHANRCVHHLITGCSKYLVGEAR